MNNTLCTILPLLLLAALPLNTAQNAEADAAECMAALQEVYRHLNNPPEEQGRVYYMKYSVRAWPADSRKAAPEAETVEYWVRGRRMAVHSRHMRVYHDESVSVVLLPDARVVYVNDVPEHGPDKLNPYAFFRDSLLAHATVQRCTREPGPQGDMHISLEIAAALSKKFNIAAVDISIDPAEKMLRRVHLRYAQAREAAAVEMLVHTIDYRHKNDILDRPALAHAFADGGTKLLPEFAGWTVSDTRTQ